GVAVGVGAGATHVAEQARGEAGLAPGERAARAGAVGEHGQLAAGEAGATVRLDRAHRQAQRAPPRLRERPLLARGRARELDAALARTARAARARAAAQSAGELRGARAARVADRRRAQARDAWPALRVEAAGAAGPLRRHVDRR